MKKAIIILTAVAMLAGCRTTKYVTVPEQHTEHHWHTDSVKERDSIHIDRVTTIRELDSAAMAQYGIRLKAAERAWLVQSREMEMRLQELEHMTANHDTIHDSIPIPYPVTEYVAKPLTRWQQARIHMGELLLALIAAAAGFGLWRLKR